MRLLSPTECLSLLVWKRFRLLISYNIPVSQALSLHKFNSFKSVCGYRAHANFIWFTFIKYLIRIEAHIGFNLFLNDGICIRCVVLPHFFSVARVRSIRCRQCCCLPFSLWKVLAAICVCNAFAGPVFEMKDICRNELYGSQKHASNWNAIHWMQKKCVVKHKKIEIHSDHTIKVCCAYFLQFNLATLKYVTDIAFIDALMYFSAAFLVLYRIKFAQMLNKFSLSWRL